MAQFRSTLDYTCLVWGVANTTHLNILENLLERANMISEARALGHPINLDIPHSTQEKHGWLHDDISNALPRSPHLQPLRLPGSRTDAPQEEWTKHPQRRKSLVVARHTTNDSFSSDTKSFFNVGAYSLQSFKYKAEVCTLSKVRLFDRNH